jgi:hypothetical protein
MEVLVVKILQAVAELRKYFLGKENHLLQNGTRISIFLQLQLVMKAPLMFKRMPLTLRMSKAVMMRVSWTTSTRVSMGRVAAQWRKNLSRKMDPNAYKK